MTTIQAAPKVKIAIKRQVALGTPASGSGGTGYNVYATPGIQPVTGDIESETVRRDGQSTLAQQGSRQVTAGYGMALSVGTQDDLWESMVRGEWVPAEDIDQSDFTSITTTSTTIVFTSGDPRALGVKAGMAIKLTGHSTAGNNGKWIPVVSANATTITVPTGYLAANAVADTSVAITIARHVMQPAEPVETYYTIEEYLQDLTVNELATDAKLSKVEFEAMPNKIIKVTFSFLGLDFDYTSGAASLTDPVYSTSRELVMRDGFVFIDGVTYNILTGFKWSLDMRGVVPETLSETGPDVVLGNAKVAGDLTALRHSLVFLNKYKAATPISFMLMCEEREADPADFILFSIMYALFKAPSKGIAAEGPMSDTLPWSAGIDETGGDRATATMIVSTSAT